MKIYFGNADTDFGSDGLFEVQDTHYYYGVEYGTGPGGSDEFRIFDGCGRSVPLHLEALPELRAALNEIDNIREMRARVQELVDRAESNAVGIVQETFYDNDYEVDFVGE